jgi:ketosteroid isomerase-like protein
MRGLRRVIVFHLVVALAAGFVYGCKTNPPLAVQPATPSPPAAQPAPPAIDLAAERAKLRAADYAFARLSQDKGVAEAFYEFLLPEATFLPDNGFPIRGRDAIKVHFAAGPGGILSWRPVEAEVGAGGDLGYTWGTYDLRTTGPDGQTQISYGKYITLWKKQPDGSWKVALDGGNASPPPAQKR